MHRINWKEWNAKNILHSLKCKEWYAYAYIMHRIKFMVYSAYNTIHRIKFFAKKEDTSYSYRSYVAILWIFFQKVTHHCLGPTVVLYWRLTIMFQEIYPNVFSGKISFEQSLNTMQPMYSKVHSCVKEIPFCGIVQTIYEFQLN